MPGQHSEHPNAGLACLVGGHINAYVYDKPQPTEGITPGNPVVGSWCLWCGGGAYNGEKITDDGKIAFTPYLRIHVPDNFVRTREDIPR